MAAELLKLYAQRHAAVGTAFSPDTNMQHEFEDAFDFNETDDQLTAIADIKRDMESTQPMDRLLCGDVGYGKTEVAMRAAFKAVQDSQAGRRPHADHRAQLPALRVLQAPLRQLPRQHRDDLALPHRQGAERHPRKGRRGQGRHPHRHPPPALEGPQVPGPRPARRRRGAALRRPPQGAPQADARRHRRARHVRHARSRERYICRSSACAT